MWRGVGTGRMLLEDPPRNRRIFPVSTSPPLEGFRDRADGVVMPPLRPHAREARAIAQSGFTLIEMVVACVLAAMVIGIVGTVVMKALDGGRDAAATNRANANAAEAAERFGADVRAARSHGRDGSAVIDRISLANAIKNDINLVDTDGVEIDWRDINVATADNLVLQADVIDETTTSSPECIEWRIEGTSTWYVRRIVRPYTLRCTGGGAALEDDRITAPIAASIKPRPGSGGAPALFAYAVAFISPGGGCTTSETSSPNNIQRNRIVGARINFSSIDSDGSQSSQTASHEVIALRSRAGAEYQTAMECDG
jgi:prepilin-type N-terminal cleavage/methylation domain-containing protein